MKLRERDIEGESDYEIEWDAKNEVKRQNKTAGN